MKVKIKVVGLHQQTTTKHKKMENSIKLGDFIAGSYKCGCVWGVVTEIKKSIVVIQKCKGIMNRDNTYTLTNNFCNVTKSRIYRFGLGEGESIVLR